LRAVVNDDQAINLATEEGLGMILSEKVLRASSQHLTGIVAHGLPAGTLKMDQFNIV
jgi:hypothetical protein